MTAERTAPEPRRRTRSLPNSVRWVTIAAAAVALAGCTGSPDPEPSPPTTGPTNTQVTDADEALTRGGLELPPGAGDVTFEAVTDPAAGFAEHYRVSFTAETDGALRLCDDRGQPAVTLTATDLARLGPEAAVTQQTRYCSSADPQDQRWIRTVLVEPGDPASAIVSIGKLPD